jgi:CO/xanthine dehydrogenase Mo-binding subunit
VTIAQTDDVIGKRMFRIDAEGKVTGETLYPSDINIPGQLWLEIRWSDRAHARVVRIDTRPAMALDGVVAVYTAADVPNNEYGLVISDQPVLCGPGSNKLGGDVVRCFADNVAVVVAETPEIAALAARLIEIDYEDLPVVTDPEDSLKPDAPQLHPTTPNNTVCHYKIRHGDMQAGWEQADVVVTGEFHTGFQEHAYLQPEAGLAYLDEEDRLTVIVAGQWVHEDQEQICHALNLPPEQVRVIYPAVGGAFGGREDMSVQIVLALATWKLGRPVKTIWSREESILYHHKRHPTKIRAKWGATREGKITAVEATVIGDAGAYNYTTNKVMGNSHLMVAGPYVVPNAQIDTYGVYTNNVPSGAFRGFGAPQASFAAEGMMNRLAEALGMDPIEIRLKNLLHDGAITVTGTPQPPGVSIPEVVQALAEEGSYWESTSQGWQRHPYDKAPAPHIRRGVGMACSFKNIGFSFGFPEQNWATIELYGDSEIERAVVRAAGAEVGQGAHTAFVQMAAQALNLSVDKVHLISHDTAETQTSGSSSASRMTFMTGNAIIGAAQLALQKWQDEDRPAIATYQYRPPRTTPYDKETGQSMPNFAYGYVAEAAEVEIDLETGLIRLVRVVCANDVGRIINRTLIEGQVEGGVVQAQGYALMEHLVVRDGRILNPYLSTYLIPTVFDIPEEVKSVILEIPNPTGPWGVRGMGEMPFIPLAAAISAAVHDATGIWIDELPMTPDRVVQALRQHHLGTW